MSLSEVHKQYESIMNANMTATERDKALAYLISRMEKDYHIPALQNEAWERENRAVIALYRIISQSRTTL